jgi:HEAT repeat protein
MEEIAALLASRRTEDRIRAVHRIARMPDPERQTLLLQALQDRASYVATLAAETLGQCADESSAARMMERFLSLMEDGLKRDPGCHVRAHLAFAFGRLEYLPARDVLRAGIRAVQIEPVGGVPFDTAAHLRANCALALAQIHAPDVLRDITLLLFDMSGLALAGSRPTLCGDAVSAAVKMEPRKAAAQALARLGDRDALIPLALRLTYPENELPEVLQECMQAVVELEDERALEWLTPYLAHSDRHLAAFAALMIARTRAPEALALLRNAVPQFSGDPLRAVVLALMTLRTEEARDALLGLTEDEREAVRLAVAEALADTPDEASRERLHRLAAKDRSPAVRSAARRALEREGL